MVRNSGKSIVPLPAIKKIISKNPKNSDTRKIAAIILKLEQHFFYFRLMGPYDAGIVANSVDPDRTTPLVYTVCPKA